MKKTIHIYSQYYFPVTNAASIRVSEYVKALKDTYNIKIITWIPNYPTWIKEQKYKGKLCVKEIWEFWEDIIRTYEFANKNEWTLLRLLNYISFMLSSFFYGMIDKKPDLIIVISPPIFVAISVFLLSKIKNIKYITEIHDLWPDSVVAFKIIAKNSLFYKIFKFFEIKIYQNSSEIIWLTQGVVNWIIDNWIEEDKIHLNYFVVDKANFQIDNPFSKFNQIINNRKISLFAWNMNEAYDFNRLSKYIRENKNVFFVFIWDGSQKTFFENLVSDLDNLIFLDRMKKVDVDKYLYYANIILVPLKDEEFFKGTFPVKWIEWIVNEKEIIFFWPKDGEFSIFLEKFKKWLENKEKFSFGYFEKNIKNLINKVT